MPKKEKRSTLLRQWEMMRMLTVSRVESRQEGRWDKASEIVTRLNDRSYAVSIRTVQRDLLVLSEIFPIELNDVNPRDYGWRWRKGADLSIPGIGASEALAMRMVEMHLQQLLPAAMLDGLQGVFGLARNRLAELERQNGNRARHWLDRIRVVAPAQPMLPPVVDAEVQADIYQAVLHDRQFAAFYRSVDNSQPKEYVLSPLGIIMRGAVSYLVACAWDYTDVRLYALHRFQQVRILDVATRVPQGFDLDRALAAGLADFTDQGQPIRLVLCCTPWVAAYLAETPLSQDQAIAPQADGRVQVTATVNDTWQLQWWLLGQGAGIEVRAPEAMRNALKSVLRETINLYNVPDPAPHC